MSTLYKRANGYNLWWHCAPGCPTHPAGKHQHCVSLRTKDGEKARSLQKDHDKALSEQKARAALGLLAPVLPTADWSLTTFIDRYELKVLGERLVTPNTFQRTERWVLDSLLKFRPTTMLIDVNEAWVREYQGHAKSKVAPATWNSRRAVVRAIFNRAVRWTWVSANPFLVLDRAKVMKKRPKRLYQEQLPLVLAGCRTRFWQLVTLFLYATGCRLHELCDVKREAVRRTQGYVEIESNKENQPKLIALTADVLAVIDEAETLSKSVYVFSLDGDRLPEETVKSAYDRISTTVKFRVSPHRFRHSHGTHVMDAGGNLKSVQTTLGHADIRTTAEFYLDVDLAAQRRSMTLLPVETLRHIPTKSSGTLARSTNQLKKA